MANLRHGGVLRGDAAAEAQVIPVLFYACLPECSRDWHSADANAKIGSRANAAGYSLDAKVRAVPPRRGAWLL